MSTLSRPSTRRGPSSSDSVLNKLKSGGAGIAVDGSTQNVYVAEFKSNRVEVFEPEPAGEPEVNALSYHNLEPTRRN